MITVTVANQKGGVGKTTTAVTLAHGLALANYTVLLVDLDPQGHCASGLGLETENGVFNLLANRPPLRDVVRTTGRPGLWLLPGGKRSKAAEGLMIVERAGIDTLSKALTENVNGARLHYLVIDTAPSAGSLQENAIYTADMLLIPSAVDHLSMEGVRDVLGTLDDLRRDSPPLVRILPTFYDEVTKESKANLERLRAAFGKAVFDPIHRAVVLREAPAYGKTIFEYDPTARAALEYADLVRGVIDASKRR